ncbi:hypothetical protein B0H14DRAFT_2571467 [Mycena olivaceomarginata]|nr:hypothetical protein B0H14DRAFT_2571467 [Mycena olivaceomarginata]
MIIRVKQFLDEVGGQAAFKRQKTKSGVKDTFQGAFLDKIFGISTKKGRTRMAKQADVNNLLKTFPKDITSPVWRIKGKDFYMNFVLPIYRSKIWIHSDTPVEILHVVLLGFVKYVWRDAIARVKKSDKEILISRLSSLICFWTWSLFTCWPNSCRDFRVIVQAASFVLQGLLPAQYIELWTSLSAVVTLVWHPEIPDLDKYIVDLDAAIKHFLDCTCGLTLQWFNKPNFMRFGPAMLFATKGFESFNAIIRSASVHSNRHAPSLDIAARMAKANIVKTPFLEVPARTPSLKITSKLAIPMDGYLIGGIETLQMDSSGPVAT